MINLLARKPTRWSYKEQTKLIKREREFGKYKYKNNNNNGPSWNGWNK